MTEIDGLVFQAQFDSKFTSVRPNVKAALDEIAVSVLSRGGDASQIGDLQEEIGQMLTGYRQFLGDEAAPNLAHALCLELKVMEGDYESLAVVIHDPHTSLGHDSAVDRFDLLMPQDPSYWLVEAIYSIREDGLDAAEARDRLAGKIQRSLGIGFHDVDGSVGLPKLVRREELFGYPAGDRRNMFHQPYDGEEAFIDQVIFRAQTKLDAMLLDLGIGTPKP